MTGLGLGFMRGGGGGGVASSLPRVALLGDSITRQNDDFAGDMLTVSTNRNREACGYMTWLGFYSKQAFNYFPTGTNDVASSGNYGISGDKIAKALARVGDVIAERPDICILLIGTNNLVDTAATFASMTTDYAAIVSRLLGAGITPVLIPILPRSNWGSLTAPQIITARNLQNRVNSWIRAYPLRDARVIVADPTRYLIDATSATGDPVASYFRDGLHPGVSGARRIGKALWEALSPHVAPGTSLFLSAADTFHATENPTGNLLTNGMMLGTAGVASTGVSGVVADSWTASRADGICTMVASKGATAIDGTDGTYQRLVITAPGGGAAAETMRLTQTTTISSANFSVGDTLEAGADIRITSPTGNFVGLRCGFTVVAAGFTTGAYDMDRYAGPDYMEAASDEGICRTLRVTLPAGTTAVNFRVEIDFDNTAVGGVTIDIGRTYVRKVL